VRCILVQQSRACTAGRCGEAPHPWRAWQVWRGAAPLAGRAWRRPSTPKRQCNFAAARRFDTSTTSRHLSVGGLWRAEPLRSWRHSPVAGAPPDAGCCGRSSLLRFQRPKCRPAAHMQGGQSSSVGTDSTHSGRLEHQCGDGCHTWRTTTLPEPGTRRAVLSRLACSSTARRAGGRRCGLSRSNNSPRSLYDPGLLFEVGTASQSAHLWTGQKAGFALPEAGMSRYAAKLHRSRTV